MGRGLTRIVVAAALLAAAVPASASAQSGSRQSFDLTFTSTTPGTSAGFSQKIDYVNPADAQAKPPAVQTIVVTLPDGAAIDTSVPEQCTAPDPVLIAQGADACPEASRVGGGTIVLDTGAPGPARLVRNDVTLLNNQGEMIFLLEDQQSGGRTVTRAVVSGRSITSEVPPIPGGPPDGFTAIDTVDLEVRAVSRDGTAFVSTPPTCPGEWTSSAMFTYRDGVSQTVTSGSPCSSQAAEEPSTDDGSDGAADAEEPDSDDGDGADETAGSAPAQAPRGGVETGRTAAAAGGDGFATLVRSLGVALLAIAGAASIGRLRRTR